MSDTEIAEFLARSRTATLATRSADGSAHLVAMWYAWLDGQLWFETKAKSQKAVNITRDDRASVLVEDGDSYDALRGVAMEGRGEIVSDPAAVRRVGIDVWERYHGEYTEDARPLVEAMMHNRIVVRFVADRVRSWDHRKLGIDAMPIAGSTARRD